jgi:hypothetical protein
MQGLLFVAQATLDAWVEQGQVTLEGDVLTVEAGEGGATYVLRPAVRFVKLVGAASDPHALLGKVKAIEALRAIGAEHLDASVVLGDVAYEVEPGFLAEPRADSRPAGAGARTGTPTVRVDTMRARVAPVPGPERATVRVDTMQTLTAAKAARAPESRQGHADEAQKEVEALARFLLEKQ